MVRKDGKPDRTSPNFRESPINRPHVLNAKRETLDIRGIPASDRSLSNKRVTRQPFVKPIIHQYALQSDQHTPALKVGFDILGLSGQ